MSHSTNQVSTAIRILQWNRDVSARASHLAKRVFSLQAEMGKFLISTVLERNTMSTKTTFKRVALVVAAAVSFGGVTAVASHATVVTSDSFTAGSAAVASTSTTVGVASTVDLTASAIAAGADALTISGTIFSSPITSAGNPVTFAKTVGSTNVNNTYVSGTTLTATGAGRFTSSITASFTPDVSGTYVIKLASGNGVNNAYVTWTVTVAAKAAITAASSTLTPSSASLSAAKAAGTAGGNVAVVAQNSTTNADAVTISATISGPGLIALSPSYAASARVLSVSSTNSATIYAFADGTAGTGVISIYAGTTLLGTQSVTFYGTPVAYTVTVAKPAITVSTSPTNVIQVSAVDVNGVAVPAAGFGTLSITSSATSSITTSLGARDTTTTDEGCSSTVACYQLTAGATAGSANITVVDSTNTLSAAPVAVRASSGVPTSVVFSTDSANYAAGAAGTLKITVADAAGPLPAGTYAVLTGAATSSLVLTTGVLPTTNVTVGNAGTATVAFNAPLSDGTVTITGTSSATTIAVTPATFTVTNVAVDAANAAADAAAEATDAANAATDAATNAMDSADAAQQAAMDAGDKADAALTAITDLASKVQSFISKITAQITALAAAVAKIKAKVKA